MYEDMTPERIQKQIRERTDADFLTGEGSYFELHTKPVAYVLSEFYHKLDAQIPISFVDETSGIYIDKRAGEFGITRKPGYKATVTLTLTGAQGCFVPAGTRFTTEDGLQFETLSSVTIGMTGSADAAAAAAELGTLYNVPAGRIVKPVQPVSKLDTVTNKQPAEGGMDEETDAALLARLYAHWREPATSSNRYDYEHWAMSVTGIGAARCIEIWDGPGTVKVIVASMEIKPVDEELVGQVAAYIEEKRAVGAKVTVVSAEGVDIRIAATVQLTEGAQIAAVQQEFEDVVQDYIAQTVFDNPFLSYNRLAFLLMGVPGVRDYTALTLNGGQDNIDLPLGQVPVLQSVEVSAGAG